MLIGLLYLVSLAHLLRSFPRGHHFHFLGNLKKSILGPEL